MEKICPVCGRMFEAQRKTAVFCSGACRNKHWRAKGIREIPSEARASVGAVRADSIAALAQMVVETRALGEGFIECSYLVPLRLRAGCFRVGTAILQALEEESW